MTILNPGHPVKKQSPISKEDVFVASPKSTATKRKGSVAIAFSKKDTIENETLNVKRVKLISSELSAEIGPLKADMVCSNDEVHWTRHWQPSPEAQMNIAAVDAFVNAQVENFKRLEKRNHPDLKNKLSATAEKLGSLRRHTDNIFQWQKHITNDMEVLEKRIDLLKLNIDALKGDKTQDEKVNWHYINHLADEMESRLEEYQQIIPSMEESISIMMAGAVPSANHINNAINNHGKILVALAGRISSIRENIHNLRSIRAPPRKNKRIHSSRCI